MLLSIRPYLNIGWCDIESCKNKTKTYLKTIYCLNKNPSINLPISKFNKKIIESNTLDDQNVKKS
jgi:hypothetical protein